MRIELRHVMLPDFDVPTELPEIPGAEYEGRIAALVEQADADWVVVYGDREHSANLLFLCGFDPRFEEALLVLGRGGARVLVVGNEGIIHAVEAGVSLAVVLAQSLSLMGQPRDRAPRLVEVLRSVGLRPGDSVATVGWKYRDQAEADDPDRPAFVAAAVVDDLRVVTGNEPIDVTRLLMHPAAGLRATAGAAAIAQHEWAAARTGAAVLRVIRGTKPGMSERDSAALMGYAGEPLSMHPIVASGSRGEPINGLRSPRGRRLRAGDGITCGIGYWGSLCCRAGLLADEADDVFVGSVVRPYFAAIATWYRTVAPGVPGGAVHDAVDAALQDAGAAFRPLLNPGHLIGADEWVHSPIRSGSDDRLASGMVLQCDIIPSPLPAGTALNCEDTVALADAALRDDLARDSPAVWSRIEARRSFLADHLGLKLAPEVLPLSFANAYLPPFWLDDTLVCTLA